MKILTSLIRHNLSPSIDHSTPRKHGAPYFEPIDSTPIRKPHMPSGFPTQAVQDASNAADIPSFNMFAPPALQSAPQDGGDSAPPVLQPAPQDGGGSAATKDVPSELERSFREQGLDAPNLNGALDDRTTVSVASKAVTKKQRKKPAKSAHNTIPGVRTRRMAAVADSKQPEVDEITPQQSPLKEGKAKQSAKPRAAAKQPPGPLDSNFSPAADSTAAKKPPAKKARRSKPSKLVATQPVQCVFIAIFKLFY